MSILKYLGIHLVVLGFIAPISAQNTAVTVSGEVKNSLDQTALPYVNVLLKTEKDSLVLGTISDEAGRFILSNIGSGSYVLEITYEGYITQRQ